MCFYNDFTTSSSQKALPLVWHTINVDATKKFVIDGTVKTRPFQRFTIESEYCWPGLPWLTSSGRGLGDDIQSEVIRVSRSPGLGRWPRGSSLSSIETKSSWSSKPTPLNMNFSLISIRHGACLGTQCPNQWQPWLDRKEGGKVCGV